MKKVKVKLLPIISKINLPTVIKSARLQGDFNDSLFIVTQPGEIFYIRNGVKDIFLDIKDRIIKLGGSSGYDERGLLGLAFHPRFEVNGIFYIHYSVNGSQGPGALTQPFIPNPCDLNSLNLKWINRTVKYDHIDTVEEWVMKPNMEKVKIRTLLNLRRPFGNHNGVNSLNFSPETGKLVFITGDGGSGFDPFNLSQDDMEISGKILEINVSIATSNTNTLVVTRFNELPDEIQSMIEVVAKGVRNMTGITYQKVNNQYVKYVCNVGQNFVESIYSFTNYKPIPVKQIVNSGLKNTDRLINFGWRGWEGAFPTIIDQKCQKNENRSQKVMAYYNEAVSASAYHIQPLVSYFHNDTRINKFSGSALVGACVYMGNQIPDLTGTIIFADFLRKFTSPSQGVLAYTLPRGDCLTNDYNVIDIDYNFNNQNIFFVCLGTNSNQSRIYLGVYGSSKVTDFNLGTVFEIV